MFKVLHDLLVELYSLVIYTCIRKPRAATYLLFLFIYDTLLTPSKYYAIVP